MKAEERAEWERRLASIPEGEDDMTPEQRAEFTEIAADFEAGRLAMVPHEDVPAFLEQLARERGRAA